VVQYVHIFDDDILVQNITKYMYNVAFLEKLMLSIHQTFLLNKHVNTNS